MRLVFVSHYKDHDVAPCINVGCPTFPYLVWTKKNDDIKAVGAFPSRKAAMVEYQKIVDARKLAHA